MKIHCEKCGRELNPQDAVWLELNCSTGKWRDNTFPEFPPEQSQGWFPFGKACADKVIHS